MKKKIGLVTFYRSNYGSLLQCFSTKRFVESIGCTCDIIDSEIKNETKQKKIFTVIRHPSIICHYLKLRKAYRTGRLVLSQKTKELLDTFSERFFSPKLISEEEKKSVGEEYDKFIVGSDQIWNVDIKVDAFNFLQFAPRDKRIVLAASFGISEIPKYNQKALSKALNGFDYISVREETGVEIVKKYSNAKVCRIADPTFIYNADEWRNFAKDMDAPSKKYILVHFLNMPNKIALESMSWLSERLNLDIIALGYRYDVFDNLERFVFVDGGPWKYVSLIDHAELILTDSFHTSLFSINFNKRFFVFHRNYSVSKQTSRISDLLKRFGMDNRLISDAEILKQNYLENQPENTRLVLEKERVIIRDYIQKSIFGLTSKCFLQGENNAT